MTSLISRTALLRSPGPHGGRGGGTVLFRRFSPLALSGLAHYLDTRYGGQFYQDAARTTPAIAEDDPVGGIADLSANGAHASQADTKRPLLKLNQQNGHPGLLFDNSNDLLAVNGLTSVFTGEDRPYTIISVFRKVGNAADDVILSASNSGQTAPLIRFYTNSTPRTAFQHRDDANTSAAQPTTGNPGTSAVIASITFTGATAQSWLNGASVFGPTAVSLGTITIDQVAIGGLQQRGATAEALQFDGYLFALAVYRRALADAERQAVVRLFGRGFGITVV